MSYDEMEGQGFISTKEHLLALLEERRRSIEVQLEAMEKEVAVYRLEIDRRLAELNNLRAEVTKDREEFVRKGICGQIESDTQKWRDEVNSRVTKIETRAITWTVAMSAFFALIVIVLKIFKVL